MRSAACVLVKDERRHIAEWAAFHLALGFDTVIALDNNSTDGTGTVLRRMARSHDIRVLDWPHHDRTAQLRGYESVCRSFAAEFAWIAFIDSDEFIVPAAEERIGDLLARHPDHAAIGLGWRVFGSAGHAAIPDALVIEAFDRRAPDDFPPNLHVKSILRPRRVRGCDNPHAFSVDGAYHDACGRPMEWNGTSGICRTAAVACGWHVHHYFVRSRAHWAEKLRRGYFDGTTRGEHVFELHDRNEVVDRSAARFAPAVRGLLAGLG